MTSILQVCTEMFDDVNADHLKRLINESSTSVL